MGAFFYALIGLLCLAGNKAVNKIITEGNKREKQECEEVCNTIYKKLRINFDVGDQRVKSEFDKLELSEIAEMLGEDFTFITGQYCDEVYFSQALEAAKRNNFIMNTIIRLWLSHYGVIDNRFAKIFENKLYDFTIYFPEHEKPVSASIFDNGYDRRIQIEEEKKILRVKTLQRIEYNLRKKYPELRFVFKTEYSASGKHTETDIHKLYFRLQHEMERGMWEYTVRGWDERSTDPEFDPEEYVQKQRRDAAEEERFRRQKKYYLKSLKERTYLQMRKNVWAFLAVIAIPIFLFVVRGYYVGVWENQFELRVREIIEDKVEEDSRNLQSSYNLFEIQDEFIIKDLQWYKSVSGNDFYIAPIIKLNSRQNDTSAFLADYAISEIEDCSFKIKAMIKESEVPRYVILTYDRIECMIDAEIINANGNTVKTHNFGQYNKAGRFSKYNIYIPAELILTYIAYIVISFLIYTYISYIHAKNYISEHECAEFELQE